VTRGALAHHSRPRPTWSRPPSAISRRAETADAIPKLEQAQLSDDRSMPAWNALGGASGEVFVAVVELWVAARTDPELQRRVAVLEQASTAMVVDFAKALFGEQGNDPALLARSTRQWMRARHLLMKIALPRSSARHEAQWRRAKAICGPVRRRLEPPRRAGVLTSTTPLGCPVVPEGYCDQVSRVSPSTVATTVGMLARVALDQAGLQSSRLQQCVFLLRRAVPWRCG